MPTFKVDGGQWFQWLLGLITSGALATAFAMWKDVATINIERKQEVLVIIELKRDIGDLKTELNKMVQKQALTDQIVRMLAKTKGMDGMISLDKFPPPTLINPVYNAHTNNQHHAASDCEKDCLPPVPPPQPHPEGDPKPTKQ